MGGGRKTETIVFNEISNSTTANGRVSSRNLYKDDLGGVIFGCKHSTMKECLSNQIFGLPGPHIAYVKNIYPGFPLFLFNYSDRKMHGIYEATSNGRMNINPYGWSADEAEETQYPAQVRVRIREQCQPLSENQFKGVINENFYTPKHFWFELDRCQVERLVAVFRSTTCASSGRVVNQGDSKKQNLVKVLQSPKSQAAWSSKNSFQPSEQINFERVVPKKKVALPTNLIQGNKYDLLASDAWGEDECVSSSKASSSMNEDFDDNTEVTDWEMLCLEPRSDLRKAEKQAKLKSALSCQLEVLRERDSLETEVTACSQEIEALCKRLGDVDSFVHDLRNQLSKAEEEHRLVEASLMQAVEKKKILDEKMGDVEVKVAASTEQVRIIQAEPRMPEELAGAAQQNLEAAQEEQDNALMLQSMKFIFDDDGEEVMQRRG